MTKSEKIDRIQKHIDALNKSYDNIILLLSEDIETEPENGKIKLKDTQRKVYAEGIDRSATTASNLLQMITQKEDEIEAIKKQGNSKKDEIKEVPKEQESNDEYPLEKYLD